MSSTDGFDGAALDDEIAAGFAKDPADARRSIISLGIIIDGATRKKRSLSLDGERLALRHIDAGIVFIEALYAVLALENDRGVTRACEAGPSAGVRINANDLRVGERHRRAVGDGEFEALGVAGERSREDIAVLECRIGRNPVKMPQGGRCRPDVSYAFCIGLVAKAIFDKHVTARAASTGADGRGTDIPRNSTHAFDAGADGDVAAGGVLAAANARRSVAAASVHGTAPDDNVAAVEPFSAANTRRFVAAYHMERTRALDRHRAAFGHVDSGVAVLVSINDVVAVKDDRRVAETGEAGPFVVVASLAFDTHVAERHRRAIGDGDLADGVQNAGQRRAVWNRRVEPEIPDVDSLADDARASARHIGQPLCNGDVRTG